MVHPRKTVSVELESQSYLQRQWWDYLAPQRNWGHVFSAHKLLTIPRIVPLFFERNVPRILNFLWSILLFSKDLAIFQQIQTWCVEFKGRKKKTRVRKRGREENIQRKERGRRRKRERDQRGQRRRQRIRQWWGRDTKSKEGGGKGGGSRKDGVQHKKGEKGKRKKKAREKG